MYSDSVKILVVDDDPSLRNMLKIILTRENYQVSCADSARRALEILRKEDQQLIISDIKMPDISGIELLHKIKSIDPSIPVIMITAFASTEDAVEAMKLGAENYITKPFNIEELKVILKKALNRRSMEKENLELKSRLAREKKFENIVGQNQRMLKIFDLIDTISQTDSTVLISGESGTGKELIARAIHNKSIRKNQKFVSVNCGALPENLLESELFGHIKGSFTDAYRDKAGLFELAHQGTLFLDEIAEMSQKMQVKLLRAIQERKIRRVGGDREIEVDTRIISATNRNLSESMKTGQFRSDLFYRLNVISIHVPALRDRKDDIPALLEYFLKMFNRKFKKEIRGFEEGAKQHFLEYRWPGNIRELENFVERAVALEKNGLITVKSLPGELLYHLEKKREPLQDISGLLQNRDFSFNDFIDDLSRKIIEEALKQNNANIKNTAAMLKLGYRSLRYLIEKYRIKP